MAAPTETVDEHAPHPTEAPRSGAAAPGLAQRFLRSVSGLVKRYPATSLLVALAAMAATLGLTTAEVSAHASRPDGLSALAAERGFEPAHVRAVAAAAVEPVLGEAIRSGALGEEHGRAILWRIEDRGLA